MAKTNEESVAKNPVARTWVMASARWLLVLRWIAGLGVLSATAAFGSWLELGALSRPLYVVGGVILAYNAVLWLCLDRLESKAETPRARYELLTHVQVGLDWVAMAALIHLSGGVESPLIFFFVFHILIASLLFRQLAAYLYACMALILVGGIAALEWQGWLPHVYIEALLNGEAYRNPIYLLGVLGSFAFTTLVTVYLASSIAVRLRRREEQLRALYQTAGAISSSLDLQEVLDRLVLATTKTMNVEATSIGLLDETGTEVKIVAAHGMSREYLEKGPILASKSRVYGEVLRSGKPLILQGEIESEWLQYADERRQEGIRSFLYVPLIGRRGTLGVVRVHSTQPHRFRRDDARFLAAISSQGAVAIENALAYKELEELDMKKSSFVRSVTHELRAPVHGAQSLVRATIATYEGDPGAKEQELMVRLGKRLDRLEALINDLLDLSAGRSDLGSKKRSPISLVEVLRGVVKSVEAQAAEKRMELIVDEPAGEPVVTATEEGIERILVNLIGNAVKYTPEGGTVSVSVKEHVQAVELVVADTGIGISGEALTHLFQEFYRAPNAKTFESGTGLGLVIVKELVEKLGGRISVESEEGKGSSFTVQLPLARDTAVRAA